jgi:hypothetical protein
MTQTLNQTVGGPGQRNTFVGNTVREPAKPPEPAKPSGPANPSPSPAKPTNVPINSVQGRFKDDPPPAGGTLNVGASQGDVNTVIESYNQ